MENQKSNTKLISTFVIIVVVIGLVVYAMSHKKVDTDVKGNMSENTINNNEVSDQNEQAKSMDKVAKKGDVLVMNYTGKLTDGTVFDSNVDPKFKHVEPFEFTLGAGQVIAGWDEGLVGMKVGEKKTLTISPEKGYGARAVGPIPANSTLIFDVELVAIK